MDTHFSLSRRWAAVTLNKEQEISAEHLIGADFPDEPSVTGTENAIMAAVRRRVKRRSAMLLLSLMCKTSAIF